MEEYPPKHSSLGGAADLSAAFPAARDALELLGPGLPPADAALRLPAPGARRGRPQWRLMARGGLMAQAAESGGVDGCWGSVVPSHPVP